METRIARYCDRVMEAGWLAAVMLTPVFFNVYSSRVFEPDKLTLLRSIALVMALAWLIARMERPTGNDGPVSLRDYWRALLATPLVPQVLLLVLVYFVATAASVVPATSFWGSYQRLQGTYTFLAYLVVFAVASQRLRTRAQLERLLNVIVLTSLPVALYGILQHYGLDPLPWAGDVTSRVTGNLGNAIFIAAYLILPFFVTLERAVSRFRRLLGEEHGSPASALAGGVYLFILAVQALAIFFSQSRGPWLGLLAGAYVFVFVSFVTLRRLDASRQAIGARDAATGLLFAIGTPLLIVALAVAGLALQQPLPFILLGLILFLAAYLTVILLRRGRRWLWLSWLFHGVAALAFLVVFSLPHGPLTSLRAVPGLGRLGEVFETESGTGRVRVLIWEGAIDLIKANPLRTLIGYGPEAMYVAYNPYYPPDLAHYESRNASPDRSHNETFDSWVTTGAIGFLVYIALFMSIFFYALRWLGFMPSGTEGKRQRWLVLYLALTIGGAIVGALVPLAVDHSLRFAGVGVPAGLIAGVALYLAIAAFAAPQAEAAASFGARELLLVSLLSLIVAHFVEIHFGIAIAATRTYFWLSVALLLSIGSGHLSLQPLAEPAPAPPRPVAAPLSGRRRKHRQGARPVELAAPAARPAGRFSGAMAAGMIGALLLGTLFYDFSTNSSGDLGPLRILWSALTVIRPPGQQPLPSPGVFAMFFLTWTLGAILLVVEAENAEVPPDSAWWRSALLRYLGISLGLGLFYGLIDALQLQPNNDLGTIIFVYYAFALGMVLLAAVYLPGPRATGMPVWRAGRAWWYVPLGLLVAFLIFLNATVVRADIYYKQGWDGFHQRAFNALSTNSMDRATAQRYYDAALYYYQKAIQAAPSEDYYLLFFGKALLERAEITDDAQTRLQYLRLGEQKLMQARQINPLNTDHTANLARLYRTWAAYAEDDATRQEKMEAAVQYYQMATKLSPHNAILYNEWGRTLQDMGRKDEALARFKESLALDDQFSQTYMLLGEYYTQQEDLGQARTYYERAEALDPGSVQVHSSLGYIYSKLGQPAAAISENLKVLEVAPQDYATLKNLAILYSQTGQNSQALAAAQAARAVAPQNEQPALDQLIGQLQAALGGAGP